MDCDLLGRRGQPGWGLAASDHRERQVGEGAAALDLSRRIGDEPLLGGEGSCHQDASDCTREEAHVSLENVIVWVGWLEEDEPCELPREESCVEIRVEAAQRMADQDVRRLNAG